MGLDHFSEDVGYQDKVALAPLKDLDDDYFFDSLFKKTKPGMTYNTKRLFLGWDARTGNEFYLDISEALRMLILGMTRCLHPDTLVQTKNGVKKVSKLRITDHVIGHDFETNTDKYCRVSAKNKTTSNLTEIQLANKETFLASDDHVLFRRKELDNATEHQGCTVVAEEVFVKQLSVGDCLLSEEGVGQEITQIKKDAEVEVEAYDITVKDTENFYLANGVLSHNSGKSFILRGFCDRLFSTGKVSACYIPDVKGEFWSSTKPVQEKFHHLLHDKEKPKGTPVIALRPSFFQKHSDLPKGHHWYSVHPLDMTQEDFFTMMNVDKMTPNQQTMMSILYDKITKEYAGRRSEFRMESFEQLLMEMDFDENQKSHLARKLIPFMNSKFYNPQHSRNIIKYLKQGFVPTINFEGFDELSRGTGLDLPTAFFCIVLRTIISARRKKKIPPVWFLVDEASRFIPNKGNPSSKSLVEESVDLDTRYGISYCAHEDTLVKTNLGKKMMKDLDPSVHQVLAYDIDKKQKVWSKFTKSERMHKELLKIVCRDKEVLATRDHRFFTYKHGLIEEVYVRDLSIGDKLIFIREETDDFYMKKITSIQGSDETACFDLSVPKYENFVLGNCMLSHNCFATQQLIKVPESIISQCRYIILPYNSSVDDVARVLLMLGLAKTQTAKNDAGRLKQRVKKYNWIVFDRLLGKYIVCRTAAPLSHHVETTN